MTPVLERPIFPPMNSAEQKELDQLLSLLENSPASVLVTSAGDRAQLPAAVREALGRAITAMRAGKAISIAPLAQRLTIQEAADVLGISRPTLVTLLEEGKIPSEHSGPYCRVQLADVLEYQEHQRAERTEALDELVRESERLGLYED